MRVNVAPERALVYPKDPDVPTAASTAETAQP
jgi:hypothetical protein